MAFKSRTIVFVANTYTKHTSNTDADQILSHIYCLLFTHVHMHMDTPYAHVYAYSSHTECGFTTFFSLISRHRSEHEVLQLRTTSLVKTKDFYQYVYKASPKFVILYAHVHIHMHTRTYTMHYKYCIIHACLLTDAFIISVGQKMIG